MTPASAGRERLLALVRGEATERPPVSFWRHFYTEENDPASLATAMLDFHRTFGWDWIKLNPRASYHLEDWGYRFEASRDLLEKPVPRHYPVQTAGDWRRIIPLRPTEGVLGEHLEAVRRTVAGAKGDPVLMTVFNPISIAGDLVPDDATLQRHVREHPAEVEAAMEAITETFEAYVEELLNAGADGLFFATTQWASSRSLTWEEYERWGKSYDLRVLARVQEAPFNLLHVCHAESYLGRMADYPVGLFNWGFDDPGNPGVEAGLELLKRPVIGGVPRAALRDESRDAIAHRVSQLQTQLNGRAWGCGPDCSIHAQTPADNLRAVADALRATAGRS